MTARRDQVWRSNSVTREMRRACRVRRDASVTNSLADSADTGPGDRNAKEPEGSFARGQVALKSSGDTLSRNSLNFSTSSSRTAPVGSSSFSSGMSRPASARTASST